MLEEVGRERTLGEFREAGDVVTAADIKNSQLMLGSPGSVILSIGPTVFIHLDTRSAAG